MTNHLDKNLNEEDQEQILEALVKSSLAMN